MTSALKLLISLLPVANRDTLHSLLHFLHLVHTHAGDVTDPSGQQVAGNKMDASNLATIFAPNILHKSKAREFAVENSERLEERCDVINVVKIMIEKCGEIFEVINTRFLLLLHLHSDV